MVLLASVLDTIHIAWAVLVIPLQAQMLKANAVKSSSIRVYFLKSEVG